MKQDKRGTTTGRLRAALEGGTALPRVQADKALDRDPLLDHGGLVIRRGPNWHLLEEMLAQQDSGMRTKAPKGEER